MRIRRSMLFVGLWLVAGLAKGDAMNIRLDAEYVYQEDNQVITAAPRGTTPHQFFGVHTQGTATTTQLVTMANFSAVYAEVGQTYTATTDATTKTQAAVSGLAYSGKADTDVEDIENHDLGWYSTDLTNSSCVIDSYGDAAVRLKGSFNLSDPRVTCNGMVPCYVSHPGYSGNTAGRLVASKDDCYTGTNGVISLGVYTTGNFDRSGTTLSGGSPGDYYCFEPAAMDSDNIAVAWAALSFPCTAAK